MIYWNNMIKTQSDEVYWLPEILLNSARFIPLQFTGLVDKKIERKYMRGML